MKSFFFLILVLYSYSVFSQTNDTLSTNFIKVDNEATFIGESSAWKNFLQENLKASLPVENGAPIGIYRVVVKFIVNLNGTIDSIAPLTNYGYGLEEEVVRVIKASKKWNPAILNDMPVRAYRKQPVTFITEVDGEEFISKELFTFHTKTDNELSIFIRAAKGKKVLTTISYGEIVALENGNFNLKFEKPGRVLVQVKNAKTNKILSEAYFDVIDKSK